MPAPAATISLDNLREALAGLAGVAERTPLIPLDLGSASAPVRLKAEQLQPMGAFKIRGAWTALRRLPAAARSTGVVTSSSGNHGLGIAFAARRLGLRAVVVMPESAPAVKVNGVRELGAEVVLAGKVRGPEQAEVAQGYVDREGCTMIPPYDHPDVIAGQGTIALEILEQWPEVRTIIVPIGGGGLLAGISSAIRATGADVTVIAAEPAGIPKLSAAMLAGKPATLTGGSSLADGLLTPSVGDLTWPLIQPTVRRVVSVSDDQIRIAVRWLAGHGLRVEPSGSVTTAAVLADQSLINGPTVLVCTGGNVDASRYLELTAE
ncbi:MAG TPA: threonine/serine dehydratase [Gemmatimonadales bacterium]